MAQEVANKFIENVCYHLVRNMDIEKVEQHFNQTLICNVNRLVRKQIFGIG
ncbi:hypothetical protein LSPH24S_09238 [Lysinibacillus sphaericus]